MPDQEQTLISGTTPLHVHPTLSAVVRLTALAKSHIALSSILSVGLNVGSPDGFHEGWPEGSEEGEVG